MDGPKRVSLVNGRSTTSARRGQIRAAPKSTSAAMASVRVNPFARPTPSITEAMPTIAITNVTVSPLITPERTAAPAGRARREQRGQNGEHAGRERGTGAGQHGERHQKGHHREYAQRP